MAYKAGRVCTLTCSTDEMDNVVCANVSLSVCMQNDFDPEEEAEVRLENQWAFV
jgi:hypothetical protein